MKHTSSKKEQGVHAPSFLWVVIRAANDPKYPGRKHTANYGRTVACPACQGSKGND